MVEEFMFKINIFFTSALILTIIGCNSPEGPSKTSPSSSFQGKATGRDISPDPIIPSEDKDRNSNSPIARPIPQNNDLGNENNLTPDQLKEVVRYNAKIEEAKSAVQTTCPLLSVQMGYLLENMKILHQKNVINGEATDDDQESVAETISLTRTVMCDPFIDQAAVSEEALK